MNFFRVPMKQIKQKNILKERKKWKKALIEKINPEWKFLIQEILGEWPPIKTVTS
jgi:hypothetical protein